jgi:hypothetical protein
VNRFFASPEVRALSKEHGLDDYLYHQVVLFYLLAMFSQGSGVIWLFWIRILIQ